MTVCRAEKGGDESLGTPSANGIEDIHARLKALPQDVYVYSFPRWKWRFVRRCFRGKKVHFISAADRPPASGALLLWGMTPIPKGFPENMPVWRMEDGFLRSVGLGAELTRPVSWVADPVGMYYDATRPSYLEEILQGHDFPADLKMRARALRERVVLEGLTKYNVGHRGWVRPSNGKRVILVPGQVETDAAVTYGAAKLCRNMALLQAVREQHKDAWVVYKSHPDVSAGLRLSGEGESEARRWCDEVVTDVPMAHLLAGVDEVHVMTSLAGFEALLREKPVTCYGNPFYAGWGLTDDVDPHPRRTRRLDLDALVAGVLIVYPLYVGRRGEGLVTPERAIEELRALRGRNSGTPGWRRDIYRFFLRRFIGVH